MSSYSNEKNSLSDFDDSLNNNEASVSRTSAADRRELIISEAKRGVLPV